MFIALSGVGLAPAAAGEIEGTAVPALAPPARVDLETPEEAERCLATAVYYESARESAEGRAAVAQVVINRSRHPAYPKTVCGVVWQGHTRSTGCQFSFTCDGALARRPDPALWAQAVATAQAALAGTEAPGLGTALNYHADYVSPYWKRSLTKVTAIGRHIFYRRPGSPPLASDPVGVASSTATTPASPPPAFSLWGLDPSRLSAAAGG